MTFLKDNILYGIWRCIIFLLNVHSAVLDFIISVKRILQGKVNGQWNLANFLFEVQKLSKLPQHVALVFQNTIHSDVNNNFLDLEKISETLSCLIGAGVTVITLYDINGILKSLHLDLKTRFEEKYKIFVASASTGQNSPIISNIIWHNPESDKKCSKMDFSIPGKCHASRDQVNIFITSYSDGKPKFLEMIKNVEKMESQVRTFPTDDSFKGGSVESKVQNKGGSLVDDNFVREYLKPRCCQYLERVDYKGWKLEPDLLISYGRRQTTEGFLPWHIRLTDIHWIKREEPNDLLQVLHEFGKCKHRYGK